MDMSKQKDEYDWMLTLPTRPSNELEWFSEHDWSLGDGFDFERGPQNEVVGMKIEGGTTYRQYI